MKDWEWHRKEYLNNLVASHEGWLDILEKKIPSPIERIAFIHLQDFQDSYFAPGELYLRPQKKVGNYTADFLISHDNTNTNIVIECDGHEFHERTKKQAAHDKKRDRFFSKEGYVVLRYTGSEICDNPFQICRDIADIINSKDDVVLL